MLLTGVVFTLLLPLFPTWAANILLVFPFNTLSQCILVKPYIEALLARGHKLTLIHAFPKCTSFENIYSIYTDDRYNSTTGEICIEHYCVLEPQLNSTSITDIVNIEAASNLWGEVAAAGNYFAKIALNILENRQVRELMHSNVTFDLVVLEPTYTEALYGLAAHFNASLIGLATSGGFWNMDTLVGHTTTFGILEHSGRKFGFAPLDQLYNWMIISEEWLMLNIIVTPRLRKVHEHFFSHLSQRFAELQQSFSLILLNQHFSVFAARPNVPGMVEVGGIHVPKQLPRIPLELEAFINEAPDGVIVMSLGLESQSKDLPRATLELIVETFEALPQRIIWKFESEPQFTVSSSIYMIKWLPQQELLAHPNVRLLITHGGMLSIIEAAHFGKPVLGLPVFFDQSRNVEYMVRNGVAELLDINTMTRQSFEGTLNKLIDTSLPYARNALALSIRFRDQLVHPLDAAVYWTEYIVRYKGAPHMRMPASNLKLLHYYGLDNILMVFGRFVIIIGLVFYVLMKL
ncbi:hypothetical protein KR222_002477, partial [Zaprionus bogoriensis]